MIAFGTWLKNWEGEGGALGDLCDDFLRDCKETGKSPSYFASPKRLRRRMEELRACREAMWALDEAEELYKKDCAREVGAEE